ncbi:nitrilase-related carbon-nitrogen hydrolase [Nanoarchaeota archaeon]
MKKGVFCSKKGVSHHQVLIYIGLLMMLSGLLFLSPNIHASTTYERDILFMASVNDSENINGKNNIHAIVDTTETAVVDNFENEKEISQIEQNTEGENNLLENKNLIENNKNNIMTSIEEENKNNLVNIVILRYDGWLSLTNENNFENNLSLIVSMNISSANYNVLTQKIEEILKKHPKTDLVLTPEFTFFDRKNKDPWIKTKELSDKTFEVYEASSDKLLRFVEDSKKLAKRFNTNIIMGSFGEIVDSPRRIGDFMYDVQLIINNNGEIIQVHRKCFSCAQGITRIKEPKRSTDGVENFINQTLKPLVLKTRHGFDFKILPLICHESWNHDVLEDLENLSVDIVTISQGEGEDPLAWISEYIQTGDVTKSNELSMPWYCKNKDNEEFIIPHKKNRDLSKKICYGNITWARSTRTYSANHVASRTKRLVDDYFTKEYLGKKIVKETGYIAISDILGSHAGVFNIKKEKLDNLEIKPDYLFATVEIKQ